MEPPGLAGQADELYAAPGDDDPLDVSALHRLEASNIWRLRIDLADAPTEVGLPLGESYVIEAHKSACETAIQVGTIVRCRVLGAVCLIDEGRGVLLRLG